MQHTLNAYILHVHEYTVIDKKYIQHPYTHFVFRIDDDQLVLLTNQLGRIGNLNGCLL